MIKFKPLADRVLVEPAPAEEKVGSIFIPDTAKEKPQRGVIVSTGGGKKDEPMTVKEGETVIYGKHAGVSIQIDGKDYLLMRESELMGVLS
jgi:chaperonin GroES